jgi:VWFA-related protein
MKRQSYFTAQAISPDHRTRLRLSATLFLLCALLVANAIVARAQDAAETIKVHTRVVFLDALVKDKKTGTPISNLAPENFEVLDEGKARPISYFTREGQARKPLSIVLILDLREDGAGRFLKRPEILQIMTDALAKLGPGDEVALMAVNIGEDEKRVWLSSFTRDPAQLTAALNRVPDYIGENADHNATKDEQKQSSNQNSGSLTIGSADPKKVEEAVKEQAGGGEPVNVEVVKGKNGSVVTRTTNKDGSVSLKRVSGGGNVTVELGEVYDMVEAVKESTRKSMQDRPNSQPALIWVSDGIVPVFFEDRDATEQFLNRSNVIFNSLTVDLRTLFKFLMPIGKPIAGWMGISVYGAAKRMAQQTGGEAVRVSRTKDYGTGLATIIGNLTARYSLGFALAEQETDDGHLHNLEVRVKAQDEKGKTRKLNVSARKGYYMTVPAEKETAAAKAQ